jgi:hypothetical protein
LRERAERGLSFALIGDLGYTLNAEPLGFVVHDGDLGLPPNGGGYAGEPYGEGPELVLRFDAAR